MDIAVGIPQRIDGVSIVLGSACLERTHHGVLPVDILQDIGVDQKVVECRVEDGTLVVCTALYLDDTQCPLPAILCSMTNGGKVKRRLLGSEVQQGILFADEGDPRLHVDRLSRLGVEGEPYPDIISADCLAVGRVDLVLPLVLIPLGLYTLHRRLLLPVA